MPRGNMEFNVEIDPSIDEVFDEGVGSSFLALRMMRWNENSPFKLDMRKWFTGPDGQEVAGKGFSFITDNGPHELTKVLLKHNFGNTREVIDQIKGRDDFLPNIKDVLDEMGSNLGNLITVKSITEKESGSFYDPKELFE